jgi:UDPglucose--hexose-1-phosphate uridylyltransferase
MPELRKDLLSDIWVVIAPERKLRPQFSNLSGEDFLSPENCPFCEGNESMTPPEIYAVRNNNKPNQPGWQLRVVPNKFPALRVEGNLEKRGEGLYDKITGIGAHEVVIETNSHTKGIDELEIEAITNIFKRRILDLKKDIRLRYIQVFKNHGIRAGATISHPHSQVVGMPVVPARVKERLENAKAHYDDKERCIYCDIIFHESEQHKRVLFETSDYIVMSPYAPRFPFELAIYPRMHSASFEEMGDDGVKKLAAVFRDTLKKLNKALEQPAYNLLLHNAPFDNDYKNYFHWHLELVPLINGTGGFELGTYTYINPTPPEEAIEVLKKM